MLIRLICFTLLNLLVPALAFALGHYVDVAQDTKGNAMGNVTVTVYAGGTEDLVTLYSENGPVEKDNPFVTDATGSIDFYVDSGIYDIVLTCDTCYGGRSYTFNNARTAWISVFDYESDAGGGGGVTGWPTDSSTKEVSWANALANAIRFGDGTDAWALYRDPADGLQFVCVVAGVANDCNYIRKLAANKYWGIQNESGLPVFQILPSAGTMKGRYPFSVNYYPIKSVWVGAASLYGDGTQCPERPTAVTINSGPKIPTFICAENNSARLVGMVPMPDNWDAGVITIRPYYIQTAADTGSVNLEVAAACRGMGETFNGTYGTEVEVDDAAVTGSNAIDSTMSASVTANGTCGAGDMLYFYIDVDATDNPTTAAATLHRLGAKIYFGVTSLSE